jgi:SapC
MALARSMMRVATPFLDVSMSNFVAITREHFSSKAWKRNASYLFARPLNTVPVVLAELGKLLPAIPIGFLQAGESFQLVAITALLPDSNFWVAPDGRWLGEYIPAVLRTYPFGLVTPEGRSEAILCVDESSALVVEKGKEEGESSFFDESGAPSQPINDILNFLSTIEQNRVATAIAVDALRSAGLIQPWALSTLHEGKSVAVSGLFRVDEVALNALDAGLLGALRNTGALVLAYAQIFSLGQVGLFDKFKTLQAQLIAQAVSAAQPKNSAQRPGLSISDEIIRFG